MFIFSVYVDINEINISSKNFDLFLSILKYGLFLILINFVIISLTIFIREFSYISRKDNFYRFLFLILGNFASMFIISYFYSNPGKSFLFKRKKDLSFWGWDKFPSLEE
jgi:uncharacterized membrane protein